MSHQKLEVNQIRHMVNANHKRIYVVIMELYGEENPLVRFLDTGTTTRFYTYGYIMRNMELA
jgi:hypothetical protein